MKVGFLTAKRGERQFSEEFRTIVEYLEELGHEVVHHMHVPLETILPLSYAQRQELFLKFYQQLADCDLTFVETSLQSTQVGFGLAYLRMKGRPIVVLSQGDVANQFFPKGEVYSNLDNMMAYQYNKATINQTIDEAFAYMEPHLDKRFTMIFPSDLMAKLDELSIHKKLPKAVYIRQLIEKSLQEQEH